MCVCVLKKLSISYIHSPPFDVKKGGVKFKNHIGEHREEEERKICCTEKWGVGFCHCARLRKERTFMIQERTIFLLIF